MGVLYYSYRYGQGLAVSGKEIGFESKNSLSIKARVSLPPPSHHFKLVFTLRLCGGTGPYLVDVDLVLLGEQGVLGDLLPHPTIDPCRQAKGRQCDQLVHAVLMSYHTTPMSTGILNLTARRIDRM